VTAAMVPYLAQKYEASLALAPGASALAQEVEVFRERPEDPGLALCVPCLLKGGKRRAKLLLRVRELAANCLDQPSQPADTTAELRVAALLRGCLEKAKLGQGCLLFGKIETGAHDLQAGPRRRGTVASLKIS